MRDNKSSLRVLKEKAVEIAIYFLVILGLLVIVCFPFVILKLLAWFGWMSFSWLKVIIFTLLCFVVLLIYLYSAMGSAGGVMSGGGYASYEHYESSDEILSADDRIRYEAPQPLRDLIGELPSPPSPGKPKQVRVGIVEQDPPEQSTNADVLSRDKALVQGRTYFLRIDVSAETEGSNVVKPVEIPPRILDRIPEGDPLEVVVYSQDFKLTKGVHGAKQTLKLPKERASTFAYVQITAPEKPEIAQLWICVFYRNALLQWLVTSARIVAAGDAWDDLSQIEEVAPYLSKIQLMAIVTVSSLANLDDDRSGKLAQQLEIPVEQVTAWRQRARQLKALGNESVVEYTISPTFTGFESLEAPDLAIVYDGAAGRVVVKGGKKVLPQIEVDDGLRNTLGEFRQLMAAINESKPDEYAFMPDNYGENGQLAQHLLQMADLGCTTFNLVFNQTATQDHLRHKLKERSIIEIALKPSQNPVPWNAIYDLPLYEEQVAKNKNGRRACMLWAERDHQEQTTNDDGSQAWRLDHLKCSGSADCPQRQREGQSNKAYRDQASSTVCVYGFWGFKHQLQQPPGARLESEDNDEDNQRETLPQLITFTGQPELSVIGNKTIAYYPKPHRKKLESLTGGALKPKVKFADTETEIEDSLTDEYPHAVYFYCHGDFSGSLPALLVGNNDYRITLNTLRSFKTHWRNAPLVFINGCETAAYQPGTMIHLATQFRSVNASGVIGTEIKVFPTLARWFGEEFLTRFLSGQPVGKIMLDLRLELLGKFNPLGLIYTNYTLSGLRLLEKRLADAYRHRQI